MKKYLYVLLSIITTTLSFGQNIGGNNTAQELYTPTWDMGFSVQTGAMYSFGSDIKNTDSQLGVFNSFADIKFQNAWDNTDFLTVSLSYNYANYNITEPLTNSFSSVNMPKLSSFYIHRFDEKWGAFMLTSFSMGASSQTSMWQGRAFAGAIGCTYSINKDINIGLGFLAASRLERSWLYIPVGFIDWKINEYLKLRTMNGATLFYDVFKDKSLILSLTCEYVSKYYSVQDEILEGSSTQSALSDSYGSAYLTISYPITDTFFASIYTGFNFARELEIRQNETSVYKMKADTSPFIGINIGAKF